MEQVAYLRDANIMRGTEAILEHVTLSMSKSEFVYLVGRTGSGKSSLLKTFWCELPLQSGAGYIAGYDLQGISPDQISSLRRKLGIVFQEFNLFNDWTVGENLDFVLEATGWRVPEGRANRIKEVLRDTELDRYIDTRAGQLSGGEQQRLVIARAILNNPEIILADEPTGNLDPDTSEEILHLLRKLALQYNTAMLMATHDERILNKFPGRVYHCTGSAVKEVV